MAVGMFLLTVHFVTAVEGDCRHRGGGQDPLDVLEPAFELLPVARDKGISSQSDEGKDWHLPVRMAAIPARCLRSCGRVSDARCGVVRRTDRLAHD